eukprot:1706198-Pyramimonas_sp.AAC.1
MKRLLRHQQVLGPTETSIPGIWCSQTPDRARAATAVGAPGPRRRGLPWVPGKNSARPNCWR